MKPYFAHEHPLRLAHRGSTLLWPENTMAAFQGAIDLGIRYLETDVHQTADGVIVAFHDDKLERVTNGAGRIADWSYEELRLLDAGYWFRRDEAYPFRGKGETIPGLEEVLRTWPEALLNVDLKQDGMERAAADLIESLGAQERVLVASFRGRRVARFRAATGGGVATSAGPVDGAKLWWSSRAGRPAATPSDCYQLPLEQWPFRVDRRLVESAHAADRQVHVFTVNEAADMERALDMGVDGIVTDRPDILNDVVAKRAGNIG